MGGKLKSVSITDISEEDVNYNEVEDYIYDSLIQDFWFLNFGDDWSKIKSRNKYKWLMQYVYPMEESERCIIFADGSGDGRIAISVIGENEYGETMDSKIIKYHVSDHNEAEYLSLLKALEKAIGIKLSGEEDKFKILMDSQTVVQSMDGSHPCKPKNLNKVRNICKELIKDEIWTLLSIGFQEKITKLDGSWI